MGADSEFANALKLVRERAFEEGVQQGRRNQNDIIRWMEQEMAELRSALGMTRKEGWNPLLIDDELDDYGPGRGLRMWPEGQLPRKGWKDHG